MYATKTTWANNDWQKPTILSWETEHAAQNYASRMRLYGHDVQVWRLPR